MTHIETMKQALDALISGNRAEVLATVQALRAAIEQPTDMNRYTQATLAGHANGLAEGLAMAKDAQPESEPVASIVVRGGKCTYTRSSDFRKVPDGDYELYVAPVGYVPLSDDAWQKIADITGAIITRPMKDAIERAVRGD